MPVIWGCLPCCNLTYIVPQPAGDPNMPRIKQKTFVSPEYLFRANIGSKGDVSISIAVLGVDGAGKTTITKALVGDDSEVTPTIGFNSEELKLKQFNVKFFDLGGGQKIRDIWHQYLHEVYGVVYLVDSTGVDRFEEVSENLDKLLSNPLVAGKPVLILANKNDLKDAMETIDVCEQLNIESIVSRNKCPCRIEACSAIKGIGKKVDRTIKEGLTWLIGMIEHNWDMYNMRVEKDVDVYKQKEAEEREARRERVRKKREERERLQEEERKRLGIEAPKEEDGEDMIDGDPFKRLDIAELEKKEKKLKEEKQRRKKLEAELKASEMKTEAYAEDNDSDEVTVPRSNRSLTRFGLFDNDLVSKNTKLSNHHVDDDEDDADSDIIISARTRRATPRLPPLLQPIGTKFVDETVSKKKKAKKSKKLKALTEVDTETMDLDDYSHQHHGKSIGSLSKIEVGRVNSAMSNGYGNSDGNDSDNFENNLHSESMKRTSKGLDYTFDNPSYNEIPRRYNGDLDVLEDDSGDESRDKETFRRDSYKKGKKKSKKGRKSLEDSTNFSGSVTRKEDTEEDMFRVSRRQLPALDGGEDIDTTAVRKLKVKKKKNYLKKNRTAPSDDDDHSLSDRQAGRDISWTVSPKREIMTVSPVSKPSWGFAEELDEREDSDNGYSQIRRYKPNVDDDDDDDIVY